MTIPVPTPPAARVPSAQSSQAPDAVVAVYTTEAQLTQAVKHLEQAGYDMSTISVLGRGMSEERHIVGFTTKASHTARWAGWGALWGWIFAAFIVVPGVGSIAVGGYLVAMLIGAGIGATGAGLTGALTAVGIPADGIPVYRSDLAADRFLVIAHGTPAEVAAAHELLGQTEPDRLDRHTTAAATV